MATPSENTPVPEPPETIEVEITETAVIENMGAAVDTLRALKDSGVQLSIDDFGTGYSSFVHLTSLPLNVLKIDGCFVRDIQSSDSNRGIVKAIIAIARTAGLRVLAEGVETLALAKHLTGRLVDGLHLRMEGFAPLVLERLPVLLDGLARKLVEVLDARLQPATKTASGEPLQFDGWPDRHRSRNGE